MMLLTHVCIAGVGDVLIPDARRKRFLLEAATCVSTFVVTLNRFSAATRIVHNPTKEASPARRTVIGMRQSTNLVYHVNGKDVRGYLAGWII